MNEVQTNKEVYQKNLDAFKKEYPIESEKILKLIKNSPQLLIANVPGWNEVLQVKNEEGRKLILGHLFGAEAVVDEQVEQWGRIAPKSPFLVIGMANLYRIQKILEVAIDDCLIVIYEPSFDIFRYLMLNKDLTEIILNKSVVLIVEELNSENLDSVLKRLISIDTMSSYKQVILENYDEICSDKVKNVIKLMKKNLENLMVSWATVQEFTDVIGHNIMANMKYMLHGYNVNQLKNFLQGEIPAFIISAGPSLNKNIEELRRTQGKACLIAVDTAIKPLLNHGVTPDFIVIIDGKKPTELLEHPAVSQIPLVTSHVAASGVMDLHKGKKFFYHCGEAFVDSVALECGKASCRRKDTILMELPTGGSVANTAFSLAHYMNASQIVLVGQDLAMTNGRSHADGTFKEKMDKLSDEESKRLIPVEGIRGNQVYTRGDFLMFLRWFEEYIAEHKMKNVIDATQGGAKIHGTKIMSLKAAIDKVCRKETDIQSRMSSLSKLPEMLDWGAKKKLKEIYDSLPEKMECVYRKAEQGERLYKKLAKMSENGFLDEEEYCKLVKRIEKVNTFMNEDRNALFVQLGLEGLNFIMRMGIYESEEDEKDEIMQIAKQGRILNLYIKHEAKKWIEETKKYIKEREIKVSEDDIKEPLDKLMYQLAERD